MTTTIYKENPTTFYAVSSIAGSGKTTRAIELSVELAESGELVIFSVPSILKVNEVFDAFKSMMKEDNFFNIKKVTSENHLSDSVSNQITEASKDFVYQKNEFSRGSVLIVTHEGFSIAPGIRSKELWHLVWDEAHQLIYHLSGSMLKEFKKILFDDFLEITEIKNKNEVQKNEVQYCIAEVKDEMKECLKERLKSGSIGMRDSKENRTLTSHLWSSANGYCDILLNKNHKTSSALDVMFLYNQLSFCGFKSITFLGALLEQTNLMKWLILKEINFIKHPDYDAIHSKQVHQVKLKIYYGNKNHRHSRGFLEQDVMGKKIRDIFRSSAFKLFEKLPIHEKVLVMCNNDKLNNEPVESSHYNNFNPKGRYVRCQYNVEGINEFRELRNGLYIGSFNQESQYHKLIGHFKIEDFAAYYHFYQWLMRLACRNEGTKEVVTIAIPCLKLFEPLMTYFDMSLIELIPMNVPDSVMNWEDGRKEANKVKRKEVSLEHEWYLITKDSMEKHGIPWKKSINDYVKWFEERGYHKENVEVPYSGRNKGTKKLLVMCQFPDSLEKAVKSIM